MGEVQLRRQALPSALFDQVKGFFFNFLGVFGDNQQFPISQPTQVGSRHLGHQADPVAPIGCLHGQILFQGLVLEASDSTEKIELIGRDPHRSRIGFRSDIVTATEGALFTAHSLSIDGGE